jgi:Spy/CpxP family protein refolding chaperone
MNTQGKVKIQVWLLILVVFVLGGVTGASLDRLYLQKQNPGRWGQAGPGGPGWRGRQQMLDDMKRELSLSEEQVTAIRGIFDEMRKEFSPKRISECPGFKEMREKTHARILTVLTPDQQKRYDDFTQRREAEMEKRREAEMDKR